MSEQTKRLVERLREEWEVLSRRSFDSQDAGLAANLAMEAADEIERCHARYEEAIEALRTIPTHEYGDAQSEGCDPNGAWGCFREALAEHVDALLRRHELAATPKEENDGTR